MTIFQMWLVGTLISYIGVNVVACWVLSDKKGQFDEETKMQCEVINASPYVSVISSAVLNWLLVVGMLLIVYSAIKEKLTKK